MKVSLWGVRGSVPSPSSESWNYGANTPCVELRSPTDHLIIFDAGTGIRALGESLPPQGRCSLFITHGHTDHTEGLRFFSPLYSPGWEVDLYIPTWLAGLEDKIFDGVAFPVVFSDLKSHIAVHHINHGDTITIGTESDPVTITAISSNHPGGNLAYRATTTAGVLAYTGDHEITADQATRDTAAEILDNADVAVVDAFFDRSDYQLGWGHSCWEDWLEIAEKAHVTHLLLSHHMPRRNDSSLDVLQTILDSQAEHRQTQTTVAKEAMYIEPPFGAPRLVLHDIHLQEFIESLTQYHDESTLLDQILQKAQDITHADAGTVFLTENEELVFAYSHNKTLFPHGGANKSAYVNLRIPLSIDSIAGFTAVNRKSLNIPDVRALSPELPYHFNDSFDKKNGYKTESILTIPLVARNGCVLGVLQLINSIDQKTNHIQAFSASQSHAVSLLAREASNVLELSDVVRQNILRLQSLTALHDPGETGPHAERVGAIAAELYQRWGEKRNLEVEHIRYFRSQLRLAAMLHDIGKVGISDMYLKKNGKLTNDEFAVMQQHTMMGAEIFKMSVRNVDILSGTIALHHHQKWNGTGYAAPGKILKGEEIPLEARITAIADVFDALVSYRSYKKPWTFEEALALVHQEAGSHFDPELVECFEDIIPIVHMIYERFPEYSIPFLLE